MCIIRIAHSCCPVHLLNTRQELEPASPPLEAQARELVTQSRDYTSGNRQLSIPLLRPMSVPLVMAFPQGYNGISPTLEIFIHTLSSTHPHPRDHGRAERRGRGSRLGVHTGSTVSSLTLLWEQLYRWPPVSSWERPTEQPASVRDQTVRRHRFCQSDPASSLVTLGLVVACDMDGHWSGCTPARWSRRESHLPGCRSCYPPHAAQEPRS